MFKKLLINIPKKLDICFTGFSEPFHNKDVVQMMTYASRKGYSIHLYTTFRDADIKNIRRLKRIDIKSCVIHLPDSAPMMNVKVDEEYLKKLETFDGLNLKNVSYMCIGRVHPDIKKIIKSDIREAPIYLRAGHLEDDVYQKLQCINVEFNKNINRIFDKTQKVVCSRRSLYKGTDERVTLPEATILMPDGSLLLCCMDWEMKYVLGNLYENTYDEIVHGDRMNTIEDSMMCKNDFDLLCRRCEFSQIYTDSAPK